MQYIHGHLVYTSCSYFPIETTREVIEEWRPLLCPFDMTMLEGCNALAEFLPIILKPEELDQGYKYVVSAYAIYCYLICTLCVSTSFIICTVLIAILNIPI